MPPFIGTLLLILQVNICFQKIAADILGIKLSRAELESEHRVVKAEITNYSKKESGVPVAQSQKSTMCSIQQQLLYQCVVFVVNSCHDVNLGSSCTNAWLILSLFLLIFDLSVHANSNYLCIYMHRLHLTIQPLICCLPVTILFQFFFISFK